MIAQVVEIVTARAPQTADLHLTPFQFLAGIFVLGALCFFVWEAARR